MFLADARGLDFLNSIATPVDTPFDWINDGRGLVDWLRQAGLAPLDDLEGIIARAMPSELDRVADQARDLREWFRGVVKARMGRPLDAEVLKDLEPLNRLLERDESMAGWCYTAQVGATAMATWRSRPRGAGARRNRC